LEEKRRAGEMATQSRGGANIPNGVPVENTVTLNDIGISRKESSTSKKLSIYTGG